MLRYKKSNLLLVVLSFCLCLSSYPVSAQDENSDYSSCCGTNDFSLASFVYYTSPRGIGYHSGYTSLEVVAALESDQNSINFFDARMHWFRHGHTAGNFGVGTRYILPCQDIVVGGNIYYDYRKAHHRNFQQITLGFEVLGCDWDLRANAYIPISKQKSDTIRCTYDYPGGFFAQSQQYHYSFWGGDIELGKTINWACANLSVYSGIGPYFLGSKYHSSSACGGRYRLAVTLYEYVTLEGRVTYDRIFNTRAQGVVSVEIPFSRLRDLFCGSCAATTGCCCNLTDRLNDRVYRNEIIPIKSLCRWRTNYFVTQE